MICPICGKKMTIKNTLTSPLYYCLDCNFLTKGEALPESLEKNRYDSHICDEGYLKYMTGVYEKISPFLKGNKVLDFGCGKIHALSDILAKNNYQSYYYDKYYFKELKNIKYDSIVLIEVIEHILDLNELFNKLSNLLNPFGRIIVMTNFIPKSIESWWYLRDSTHVNFYSDEAFLALSKRYNFKIIFSNHKNLIVLEKRS